jgi:hypothetical protein
VFALEWGLDGESQEDSLVLALLKLAAFARDNFLGRAYLVVAAPAVLFEQPGSDTGRESGEGTSRLLELFEGDCVVGADELERIAPGWWNGDRDKPKVPRQIELSALGPVTLAGGERGDWELRCVRVGVKREWPSFEEKHARDESLLAAIKERLPDLEALLEHFRSIEEDAVYRYYHQSFKVFYFLQPLIERARALFEEIAPTDAPLDAWFAAICEDALEHSFEMARTNANWESEARPILEAFWHCKYFLEQMVASGRELDEAPEVLPFGWAAVLCLYRQR